MFFDRISRASCPRVTEQPIVCGDCAGDELLPTNTFLTTDGRCAECGGRSFEFASLLGPALARYLRNTKGEKNTNVTTYENTRGSGPETHPARESRYPAPKLRAVGS